MKQYLLLLVLCLNLATAMAQQDPMYTHYMNNTVGINPAYAGSREALTATLLHRAQWVDFPGAPVTTSFTAHAPVLKGVNLGLTFTNDKIGFENTTNLGFIYAYRFNVTRKAKLALGLNVGMSSLTKDFSSINLDQAGDPSFSNIASAMQANFGFGAYYSTERFYAGLSVPRILENISVPDESGVNVNVHQHRHYFAITGAMIPLNYDWDIKPTGLLKVTEGSPIQLDMTCEMVYQNKIDFGLFYRSDLNIFKSFQTGDGIGAMVGFNVLDNLHVGYSYDYSFANATGYSNLGSHEIMLRYDFNLVDNFRIRSPRYF
jgi:type IX secretion system PorP/SprF family membrane protein